VSLFLQLYLFLLTSLFILAIYLLRYGSTFLSGPSLFGRVLIGDLGEC
jgi:hypothetical protein